MQPVVREFIRAKKINSLQKLYFLLMLHKNPEFKGTIRCFAERLHLGDIPLVERLVHELKENGVLKHNQEQHYELHDPLELKGVLKQLTGSFENPLTRQSLLKQIQLCS